SKDLKSRGSDMDPSLAHFSAFARREDDRVGDRRDAAVRRGERERREAADDALRDRLVGEIRARIACDIDAAVTTDDELRDDATLEARVVAEATLVAEAEATEVLANDSLDDLGRDAAVRV